MPGNPTTPLPEVRIAWRPEQFTFVTNGTFETNTSGWSTSAGINAAGTSITRITTDFHSGAASASVVCSATDGSGVNFDMGSTTFWDEGDYGPIYIAVVWMKRVSGGKRAKITLGSEGTSSDRATLTITDLTDAWAPYTVRWLPTANRTDVQLAVTNGSAEAVTFLIDDVAVYLLDAFSQVENGTFEVDTTGWSVGAGGFAAAATSITQTAGGFGGSYCGRVVTSGASATSGTTFDLGSRTFLSGRTYRLRIAAKTVSGSTAVALQWGSPGGADSQTDAITLTSSFQWFTSDWTPSADRTDVELCIRNTTAASRTFDIDEVEVYERYDDLERSSGAKDVASLTWTRPLDGIGTATLTLFDTTGRYSPRNASGSLYGSVAPGKRVYIRSVYGNVLYPGFYGTIVTIEPRAWDGVTDIVAEDMMAEFARGRFASSFIENVSYYTVRGRVIAAVLNRDPWLEDSTTGGGKRARYLHGPEGNNFYTGTDGVVGALDVLEDLNEATGSVHYIEPSVHAMIGWRYTSRARTQITDTSSDFTFDDDFEDLSGVRYTHEALENYQQVPWQGFEMGPVPEDDTNGNGSGTVAQAIVLEAGYGDTQPDLDPYLHYTREEYGDNSDVPEPTYKVTVRRRRPRRDEKRRSRGRRFVKRRQRIYPDAFVPFTVKAGEVRRVAFDFALPVSGPILSIQGPSGVTAITITEVEKSPNRYVLDLSASADTVVDYLIVNGTVWTPLDEEEAIVSTGSDGLSGSYPGPGFSTPYIPAAGDAEGLGAYRNWRYGEARMRPTVTFGVGQIANAMQLRPTHHVTLTATRWGITALLFIVTGVTFEVTENGLAWKVRADLEELPDHADYFVWDTNAWDDSSIWAY